MEPPQGVVFDMDGTLLDSERLARTCFLRACADIGMHDFDISVYDRCVGSTGEETQRIMKAGFGADFDFVAMEKRWSYHYHAAIDAEPVALLPGIEALLEHLTQMQIPMAVATSSRRAVVEKKLSGSGIAGYFQHLICGGEAQKGKPHPHPYLMAVDMLSLPAACCWAVEDSDNGVRSAHSAGLQVFQIPNELAPDREIQQLGHPILHSAEALLTHLLSLKV